jgi:hypothetical protein
LPLGRKKIAENKSGRELEEKKIKRKGKCEREIFASIGKFRYTWRG